MRVRQASMAASTSSGSRSASVVTGLGELITTSCAPTAGREVNSSGMPRPERIGSSAASGSPGPSAGYRLGTTRTVQPGVSAPPPPGRSAQTSGGVFASLPSANGSASGSIGGRSSIFELNGPGCAARSPAMIARSPLSGSMRSSGKVLLHRQVRDPLFDEQLPPDLEAAALIESARRGLRVQPDPLGAGTPRLRLCRIEDRRADTAPAQVGLDGHPPEPCQAV